MHIVKWIMVALGLTAAGLAVGADALDAEGGGIVVGACVVPSVLAGAFHFIKGGTPRWVAVVSLLCFLVAAMKTTNDPFQNVMMAAFFAGVLALVLAIKPDAPKKADG